MLRPIPIPDSAIENIFWKPEEGDKLLPSPGFITDFVLSTRGIETPTFINMWVGLFLVSSVLNRDSHLKWHPSPLYPNLYTLIVAPPRICAKTTSLMFGTRILANYHKHILDGRISTLKTLLIRRSKATQEKLVELITPQRVNYFNSNDKKLETLVIDSHLTLAISELATFLGRQKYNTGLVEKLTHLYDCPEIDTEDTISRGSIELKNVYVTLCGATTEVGLKQSVPESAFGDGFISRLVLVFQNYSTRNYSKPKKVIGAPDIVELEKRLAWIAQNTVGEYALTDEADQYYSHWYNQEFKPKLKSSYGTEQFRPRLDNHILKLAVILRAQRYEIGKEITLSDLQQSIAIMTKSDEIGIKALATVGVSFYTDMVNRVEKIIYNNQKINRRRLLTMLTKYNCTSELLLKVTNHLQQEGKIQILWEGAKKEYSTTKGKELYKWSTTKGIGVRGTKNA